MRHLLKITGAGFAALLVLIGTGFGWLQTGSGKAWLGETLTESLSEPGSGVAITDIGGVVPFDMRVSHVALTDTVGVWATIDGLGLSWSPSSLLGGTLRIDRLSADRIDIIRPPAASGSATPSSGFALPHLPVGIAVGSLTISRLALGPGFTASPDAAALVAASATLTRGRADLALKLARVDGQPGFATVALHYDQPANALDLDAAVEEQTGILLDALLGRTDKLPLSATLKGGGPLSGWKGSFILSSTDKMRADATIEIAQTLGARIAVAGTASVAPLLPDTLRPVVGDTAAFDIIVAADGKGGVLLAPSRVALAGLTMTAEGLLSDGGALTGKAHLGVSDLAALGPLTGDATRGAIDLDIGLSGTADRPRIDMLEHAPLVFGTVAVDGLTLDATVVQAGKLSGANPAFDLSINAEARNLHGTGDSGATYGAFQVHVAGVTDTSGNLVDLREARAAGAGIDFNGKATLKDGAAEGQATVSASDLSIVGGMLGQSLGGAAKIDIGMKTGADRLVALTVTGGGEKLRTGIPAADALLSGPVKLDANGTRAGDGRFTLGRFTLESQRARIDAGGGFSPADRAIDGTVKATLADLAALSSALQSPLAGAGGVSVKIGGTLDQPAIDADATLDHLAFHDVRIDHFAAKIQAPQGLNGTATIAARIDSGKLAETIDASGRRIGDDAYRLDRLRLAGTGGTVDGAVSVDVAQSRVGGKIDGAIGDLSVWSGVAGQPLAGRAQLSVDLPGNAGQGPVKASLDHVAVGTGPESIGIRQTTLTGTISGDFAHPSGALDLTLSQAAASGVSLSDATAHVSGKANAADFQAHLAGRMGDPVTLDVAGRVQIKGAQTDLRLARFQAKLAADTLSLTRPASITIATGRNQVTGLALSVDGGAVEGDAALSPHEISADLRIRQMPLHPLAALAGKPFVGGALDGRITLAGTPTRPEAHLALTTKGLDLQTGGPLPRPNLDLTAAADWRDERANLRIGLSSGTGETLTLTGSAPFAFDFVTFNTRRPADPKLALALSGGGRLENLTSIVPLGEDRIQGAFTVDVRIGGTLDAPQPAGKIAVTQGRYANMALGTEIDGIDLAMSGSGQRFVLDHLTATDAGSGTLTASGAVDLAASPASVGLYLGFTDFRVAHSDDLTVNADGALKLSGTVEDMKVAGTLGVRRAEIYIPDRLPASVVNLDVIEIGGRQKPETAKSAPVAPVALQIALDAPGQIFVRGHGVTSAWRGHIDVTDTTDTPVMNGQLSVVNGTVDLLGQTFNIDRGAVTFGGGPAIDPTLDVQASASASGVTANVNVTGTANAPKIALGSPPALPQDEILSRVLFGQNVGSLTASQGLQLAAAAAGMAQGGPGVLDRVRSTIGLDRLDIGAGGANPSGTQGAAKGTTVTGGKYIANGVFVGVSQGLSGNSSEARVEVEITPNISVTSSFGPSTGSGVGAKYSVDY